MTSSSYKKLPGSGYKKGFFAFAKPRCRLWVGDDHLLLIESSGGYQERYKRYYLNDIKAITFLRTKAFLRSNIVFGILCILAAVGLFPNNPGFQTFSGFMLALFLIPLVINIIKGPTCNARILTAVQNEELPSMNRVRAAEKALAFITPLIQEAQAKRQAVDVPSSESGFQESPESEPASPAPSPVPENPPLN